MAKRLKKTSFFCAFLGLFWLHFSPIVGYCPQMVKSAVNGLQIGKF